MRSRRLTWLILWLFSLVLISIRGGAVSWGFFFFCTLIPVISYLYLIAALFQFGIYQSLESRVMTAGEPVNYSFTLQNQGFLTISSIKVQMFPNDSYVEKIPNDIEFELLPGETYDYDTRLIVKYRGTIKVGVRRLILTDYLRMFTLRYKLPSTLEAIVNPRVPSPDELQDISLPELFRNENRKKQEQPDMTVREYVTTDEFKRIHWKASASMGKLMTRLYTGEQQAQVRIFFDTFRNDTNPENYLPAENSILELTLGLAQLYSLQGQQVQVAYPRRQQDGSDISLFELEQYSCFDDLYDEIRQVIFEEHFENHALRTWAEQIDGERNSETVLVILQRVTEDAEQILTELADRHCSLQMLLVDCDRELPMELEDYITLVHSKEEESL